MENFQVSKFRLCIFDMPQKYAYIKEKLCARKCGNLLGGLDDIVENRAENQEKRLKTENFRAKSKIQKDKIQESKQKMKVEKYI